MTLIQLIRTIRWLKTLDDAPTSSDDGAHGSSPSGPQPLEAAAHEPWPRGTVARRPLRRRGSGEPATAASAPG
jgi:hypothetical protein